MTEKKHKGGRPRTRKRNSKANDAMGYRGENTKKKI